MDRSRFPRKTPALGPAYFYALPNLSQSEEISETALRLPCCGKDEPASGFAARAAFSQE